MPAPTSPPKPCIRSAVRHCLFQAEPDRTDATGGVREPFCGPSLRCGSIFAHLRSSSRRRAKRRRPPESAVRVDAVLLEPIATQPWGGDRHAILIFRCERRLHLEIICADNQWIGQGTMSSSPPPAQGRAGGLMITKLPLVSWYRC